MKQIENDLITYNSLMSSLDFDDFFLFWQKNPKSPKSRECAEVFCCFFEWLEMLDVLCWVYNLQKVVH